MELKIPSTTSLTKANFANTFSQLKNCTDKNISRIHIDFSSLNSLDQFSLIGLLLLPSILSKRCSNLKVVATLPHKNVVSNDELFKTYIEKIIFKLEKSGAELIGSTRYFPLENNLPYAIIPLTKIHTKHDSAKIGKNFFSSEARNCKLKQDVKHQLAVIASELSENIVTHSRSYGYIMSQYYSNHRKSAGGFIKLTASDSGIGIKEALGYNPKIRIENDAEAIITSLEKHKTGISGHNRGGGLPMIAKIIKKLRGYIYIRSENASLDINCYNCNRKDCRSNDEINPSNCKTYKPQISKHFYGTQVEIGFPV